MTVAAVLGAISTAEQYIPLVRYLGHVLAPGPTVSAEAVVMHAASYSKRKAAFVANLEHAYQKSGFMPIPNGWPDTSEREVVFKYYFGAAMSDCGEGTHALTLLADDERRAVDAFWAGRAAVGGALAMVGL